ncbi:hypothetical protein O181_058192 [Austropuccinia psidii MF-1]|uniref:Amino acid permease/ SLC12A domain-containing protein n=1 Tax=Austropuccinia psidii MF-1 TaxID=1389203 RepID=A0A9Q3EJ93_9BASI|nr:hypothetical protein [Austropuccinia psidii MF-1]
MNNNEPHLLESQKQRSSSDDPNLIDLNQKEKLSNLQSQLIIETNNLDSDPEHHELKRVMKSRHIQMISIGGVIGTGLFLGTASSLAHGGPIGLLLGYACVGTIAWNIMASLGEMVSHLPIAGGHIALAKRFVNPSLSFTMGYTYLYNWLLVLPAELSAAALLVNFWTKSVNNALWITIFLVIISLINLGGAKFYAEFEFWFASIKVVTIVALIILGIILDAGGGPNHDPIGFRYWRNPGPFVQYKNIPGSWGRFLGFWAVLVQASFSFIGTEITALTAAEAKNPKKTLPSAIKGVAYRICIFYILGTFIIGILVPSNDPRLNLQSHTAASSPFVIAIENSGIKVLPSIINAALLSSAWSAASSDMYTSSRALYALALAGNAPAIFKRTTSWGLPWVAMMVSIMVALVAYMSVGSGGAGEVFGWLSNMTSVCGLLSWTGIFITYLRFDAGVKFQNIDRNVFPYKSPLRTMGAIYGLLFCCSILLTNSFTVFMTGEWDTATFITGYFPIINIFFLYGGSYYYYKKQGVNVAPIPLQELDFVTDARDESRDGVDDLESESSGLRTFAEKFKTWREG